MGGNWRMRGKPTRTQDDYAKHHTSTASKHMFEKGTLEIEMQAAVTLLKQDFEGNFIC